MEFFTRFRNPLVLVAVLLAQVLGLALQVQRPLGRQTSAANAAGENPDGAQVTLLRRWTLAAVTPWERVGHGTSLHLRHLWWNYIDLRHARDRTQELQAEVQRLRTEQAAFAEDAAQGRRLQAVLAFKQQYVTNTVAAQVIGTSGTDRSHVLTLDKGWVDGLRPEQPVMTPDGVVGKLRDVFPHSAQLLLLNDASSGAGVILLSTRLRAVVRGATGGEIQINNLTPDERIKPGERVVTSGGDMVFPRGLPVGVITRVMMDPQHQPYTAITVRPAANLQQLEEVLVVTGTSESLPVSAQKDAAVAETLAAENRRAADLIAERLPSLHEQPAAEVNQDLNGNTGAHGSTGTTGSTGSTGKIDTADAQVGGLPGIPSSGVPRVKATLHADRYSPGATPSAEELTPGGAGNATSTAARPADAAAMARPAVRKPVPASSTSARLAKPSAPPAAPENEPDQP